MYQLPIKTLTAVVATAAVSIGILHSQSANDSDGHHEHDGHDHAGHDHNHDHDAPQAINGDQVTLSQREQEALGLELAVIEMRPLSGGGADVIAVPQSSLTAAPGNKFFVYIQDESDATKFVRSEVTLGESDEQDVDALTGLFPGDKIVVEGAQRIGSRRVSETTGGPRSTGMRDDREPRFRRDFQNGEYCPFPEDYTCVYETRNRRRVWECRECLHLRHLDLAPRWLEERHRH